jgi:hypothetical protein
VIVKSGVFVHGVRGPRTAHAGARWVRTTALLTEPRLRSAGILAAERTHQAASDFLFGPFAQGLTEASKSPQTTQAEHEPTRSGSATAQT